MIVPPNHKFVLRSQIQSEEKLTTLEEKRSDALEMAAQAHEEREAQTIEEVIINGTKKACSQAKNQEEEVVPTLRTEIVR